VAEAGPSVAAVDAGAREGAGRVSSKNPASNAAPPDVVVTSDMQLPSQYF
jgi:hypothetical protein